jgi:site-specific DNA recombinase
MTPTHTTRKGRRYRYYVCIAAQKSGWGTCPSKSIPAQQIEAFVVDRIRCVGRDPELLHDVLAQAREKDEARTAELETEQRGLEKDVNRWHAEVRKLSLQFQPSADNGDLVGRLADLHGRIGTVELRVGKVRQQIQEITEQLIPEEEATQALSAFDPVWETLTPNEQARVIELLVEKVEYDGRDGKVTVTFHPTGIKALADELAERAVHKEIAWSSCSTTNRSPAVHSWWTRRVWVVRSWICSARSRSRRRFARSPSHRDRGRESSRTGAGACRRSCSSRTCGDCSAPVG